MEIKNDNYITIPAIARLEHDLKGNDLLVYGIIHGFTQHRGWCDCGLQYICDWIGCADKSRVSIIISRLVELGVIEKQDVYVNNVKFCKYRAITQHRSEKHNGGIVESTTNNIEDNILPLDIDKPISSPKGDRSKDIENRRAKFHESLRPYIQEYGEDMIIAFYNYWVEKNPKGTKMRFEMEKTFEISRRLSTWKRNEEERKFRRR